MIPKRSVLIVVCTALVALCNAQTRTYIALGDSVAWGYQPNNVTRSAGDKGYVKIYADWLGTQQGIRPRLVNLGIPGETTASFSNTSEVGGLLNSNYPLLFRKSQADTFKDKVAAERTAGRTITEVTFALGANDLLDMQTTQFLALPYLEQVAIVEQTLAAAQPRLNNALTLIRQQCPAAQIKVPGYYNPYGAFPGTAQNVISNYAIPRLNETLFGLAKRMKLPFARTYQAFVGQELALTWIGEDDVHPRDPGYALIGQAVIAAKYLYTLP